MVVKKHINDIRVGDLVLRDGVPTTVCGKHIKRDPLIGRSIFGDCYKCGHEPVLVVTHFGLWRAENE